MGDDSERTVKIAVLQAGTAHYADGNPGLDANFSVLAELAREAAGASPDLIVFPEYAISGWPYPLEEVINGIAEPVPGDGPWFRRYVELAKTVQTPVLGWLVESSSASMDATDSAENKAKNPLHPLNPLTHKLYNAAFLVDANGSFVDKYRKVHANLGEQTWWGWSQGDALAPIEFDGVRYGISICADMWFPETVLCESLLGADVILHISIADDMGHIIPVRALDSEIPIVASIFQGGSFAVDARGEVLGKLPAEKPGWHVFDLQPFEVRAHRKYGGLWIPKLGHRNLRNVAAYDVLVDPSTRPPWTDVFLDDDGNPQTKTQLLARFSGRYDANDPEV